MGYKAFISIICNFDIWCKVKFDKQLYLIEKINQIFDDFPYIMDEFQNNYKI